MPTLAAQIFNATEVRRLTGETLRRVVRRMTQAMGEKGRNASGRSLRSLRVETTGVGGTLRGPRQWIVMETGRRGGKVPQGFTAILERWIKEKGISVTRRGNGAGSPSALRSVAWLMARSIKRHGTRLHRRHGFDDIFSTAAREETDRLGTQLLLRLGSDVDYLNRQLAGQTP